MKKKITYDIATLRPYINWSYFFFAWGLSGKAKEERASLKADAEAMLDEMENKFHTYGLFGLYDANSDGDDIIIGDHRLPVLRQQKRAGDDSPSVSLADFIRPLSSGIKDKIGVFATTVDIRMETSPDSDPYKRMLSQTLADRLAEATAERLHEEARKSYWGYAPQEHLTMEQLLREDYEGIRPAVGYPSLPDASINFLIDKIIDMKQIGIRLTETGAMKPHASVSGLMIAHPRSFYFAIGRIGEDQLSDYARRRGLPVGIVRRYLAANLS